MIDFDALKLCYVDGDTAWFTSAPLALQWGDDWDDAPYEHNAGYPYPDHKTPSGERVQHDLLDVKFKSDHVTPCDGQCNSRWSVKAINAGNVAWLGVPMWRLADDAIRPVQAGASLRDFVMAIESSGGTVYFPRRLFAALDAEVA